VTTSSQRHERRTSEFELQLIELIGDRARSSDMVTLADESVPLREAFATPTNAGVAS
jgi:hypothetical protein